MGMRKRTVRPPVKLPMYFGNPAGRAGSEGEAKRLAAYAAGELAWIDTPRQGNKRPEGLRWCADNGAFSEAFDEAEFLAFLEANVAYADTCDFATVPDVVNLVPQADGSMAVIGDAEATLERGWPWFGKIRALGFPVAFVAQDGWAAPGYVERVPWELIDVLFIGGSDEFKLGPEGRQAIRDAQARGKRVHMGRVSSEIRHRYAAGLGVDTVDGTFLTKGNVEVGENVDRLVGWVRRIAADLEAGGDDAAWRGRQAYAPAADELELVA